MEIKEFRDQLLENIAINATTNGTNEKEEFFDIVSDLLEEAEILTDPIEYLPYEITGYKQKKIQIDGYYYNELDEELMIFTSTPLSSVTEKIKSLTATEADRVFTKAKNIIQQSEYLIKYAEESAPGYGFVCDIIEKYKNVKKYSFYLLSDMSMSKYIKAIDTETINGVPTEYHIWDITRLYKLCESSEGKESIVIDLREFSENGIPCLPASQTDDYIAYLCNIPGNILASLYNTYGGRLLEGNVRSFLQTKGKVNKGIRNTILNEPNMFFAYNNGIAGTAYDIKIENIKGQKYITEITALQIVNGGQTTASLATALIKDTKDGIDEKIKDIYVPMKLSVVSPEKAQVIIPNISRFANSQNKVSNADLWSNHPFHIRMEELSRRYIAPATEGRQYGTYWYYERANGQYKQETYKSTDAVRKKFELQNPKNQLFKKTDLAKFMNIYSKLPHIASAGGQKSFENFAKWVSKEWDNKENIFNEGYFRRVISLAILFKEADKLVRNQSWYNSYKANIVAYSLAKIIHDVKELYPELTIDYNKIWQKQTLSEAFREQIEITSKIIYQFLINPNRTVENVTEWAKRETCWDRAKMLKITYNKNFLDELIYKSKAQSQDKEEIKKQKMTKEVQYTVQVVEFGVQFWKELKQWEIEHDVLDVRDMNFIDLAIKVENGEIPTDKQCKVILKTLEKARMEGFPK